MKYLLMLAVATSLLFVSCDATKKTTKANNTMATDNEITNKYWKLITLDGQAVTMSENQEREAHFILHTADKRVSGFTGCNNINGSYDLKAGQRLKFAPMATTMMACPDKDLDEGEFLKVFELADNYTIKDDTLSLNVGRRAPLAVFVAVYLK